MSMRSEPQMETERPPVFMSGGGKLLPPLESALFINEIAEAIAGELEPAHLIAIVAGKVKQLLGADEAALFLIDPASGDLTFESALPGGAQAPWRLRRGQGIGGWVAEHGKPVHIEDVRTDPRWSCELPLPFEVLSVVAVPLFIGPELCGVLQAVNSANAAPFQTEALEALLWLAPHVALAVKNARIHSDLVRSHEAIRRSHEDLERKIRERTEQIAQGKREWERTFDAIREPLFLVDGFAIRRANLAVAALGSEPIRTVIGKPCFQVLGGRTEPCPGCPLTAKACSGEVHLRGRLYRASYFPFEGGGMVAHYRDVTDARRLEDRLRESQRMASVGQLAAGAAHEINNPLGFLISNLSTLENYFDDLRKTFSRFSTLQALVRAGQNERAIELLSRADLIPEAARDSLEEAPEILRESREGGRRVHEIVKALKELAAHDGEDKRTPENIAIVLDRALKRACVPACQVVDLGWVPAHILGEPLQLEIAFANVLRNALQASEEGAPIRIGVARDGEWVVVTIADSGCGMTPEVRRRVFDPFFTTRGVGGGLGLGLTATYGIITRHGGSIAIDSEPGCGTEVSLRLPAA